MINITCHCGETIDTNLEEDLDLASSDNIYRSIIGGSFMAFDCPNCSNTLKTEVKIHLFDEAKDIDIQFLPELERASYLSGKAKYSAKRVVIGYPELVEKISVIGQALDDRIIEIIKFRLLEKSPKPEILIRFSHKDQDNLIFHIDGLRTDQVGVSKVPIEVYENISNNLDSVIEDENISLILKPPYVSINCVYLEA